jgi:hypothetical protein
LLRAHQRCPAHRLPDHVAPVPRSAACGPAACRPTDHASPTVTCRSWTSGLLSLVLSCQPKLHLRSPAHNALKTQARPWAFVSRGRVCGGIPDDSRRRPASLFSAAPRHPCLGVVFRPRTTGSWGEADPWRCRGRSKCSRGERSQSRTHVQRCYFAPQSSRSSGRRLAWDLVPGPRASLSRRPRSSWPPCEDGPAGAEGLSVLAHGLARLRVAPRTGRGGSSHM